MNEQTQIALSKFAREVVKQSKRNLTNRDKKDTKKLYNSLGYDLNVSKNSFSLAFLMEDYGSFVDQGVRGKKSSSKAPKSPYRFGSGRGKKGGLTDAINKWTRRKGLQFREKNGRFLSYDSTAFLITRSIYNKGIKPSLFFTKPFERAFKRLPDELIEKYGLELDNFIEHTLNKFENG